MVDFKEKKRVIDVAEEVGIFVGATGVEATIEIFAGDTVEVEIFAGDIVEVEIFGEIAGVR
jgi:xanthosine utilization system XapX-like protein